MIFKINTKTFIKFITPAVDIATKNTLKDHSCEGLINLTACPKCLMLRAYVESTFEGSASVCIKVNEADGYEYIDSGDVCIRAKELMSDLKSFPPSNDLEVRIKDGKLRLSPVSDRHNNVKIPLIYPIPERPERTDEYDQEVTVDREYFVKGLQQIQYAPTKEEKLHSYVCIVFESTYNTLKFSAGSGGHFAVVEYRGNDKVISSEETRMIFPKYNVPNIIRIFKKVTSPTISIRSTSRDPIDNIPMCLVIAADNITVCIYGLEHFTKYPDLNQVIEHEYTYQVTTKIEDWKYAAKAISGSRHSRRESVHNSKIVADMQHRHFDLQTNTHMQMNRRVPFESDTYVTDSTKEKSYKPWFCCNARYLIELPKKNKKKKVVIFNFEDQAELDGLSDKEKWKKAKPVLLKFPDEIDKNGVMEKSVVFFSISTKWDDSYWSEEHEEIESKFDILDL
jgi:hypothetical protein